MNSCTIIGRITRKPEYTPAIDERNQFAKFTVAVNRSYGDSADFFDCIIFGKRADVIEKYFDRGSEIAITGRMECDPYVARDGKKRYPWTLKIDDFDFTGGSRVDSKQNQAPKDPAPAIVDGEAVDSFQAAEEDLPF